MSDDAKQPFASLVFEMDGTVITFDTADAARNWIREEVSRWNALRGGPQANDAAATVIDLQIQKIQPIANVGDEVQLALHLKNLQTSYVPANGNFGRLIVFSEKIQIEVRRVAAAMFIDGPRVPWNNNAQIFEAKALAVTFKAVLSTQGAFKTVYEPDAREMLKQMGQLRSQFDDRLKEMSNLLKKVENEWDEKIKGFEAKAALSAPKTYWADRAKEHRTTAERYETKWNREVTAFLGVTALMAVAVLTPVGTWLVEWLYASAMGKPPELQAPSEFYTYETVVKGIAFFATMLAIGVWWLRQELRTRWLHEHLAEDAAERTTMVETYAAMRLAGLETGQLNVILAALYRPAVAGPYAEDAGPALLTDVLAKAFAKVASKADT